MAANNQVPSKQLIMYPKHLVYPDGVDAKRDVCLEELRASRTRYCPSPSPDCDMDMTEAYCGNITVNVPVVASMEKGREVLHLMEHKPEKLLVLSKEEPGGNMTRELQEKENLPVSLNQFDFTPSASESYSHQYSYNGASFSMKGALSFSESDSLVSSACQSEEEAKMFKEKTVLKQERHSDQVHQSLQYTHSSESLYANNKLPCPKTKPVSQLSRTLETDIGTSSVPISSIAVSQEGRLDSFSVYNDSQVSINQPAAGQSTRPPLQVLPQEKSLTSFSVYEEASINQPSFKQSAPARPPLQVLPQDKSMGSFSVYEEASINQPSFKQSAPPAKPPLQVLPQDKSLTSFSVYEEASINQPSFKQSAPPARPPLQVLPQDKSVYDEASISHPSQPQTASSNTMPMKVLNCAPSLSSVPLTTSDASSHCLASIEKLSLSQKAPVTISTSLHSHNFPVPSSITNQEQPLPNITNPVSSTHSLPVPFSINNPLPPPLDALPVPQSVTTPPTNEQEAESISPESGTHSHPLVNETIDPSFFIPGYLSDDPTSTPCGGRRVGLAPFDVTAIQSYSPQSSNTKPLPPPPPLPVPSLPPPPPPPPPSQPLPQTDPAPPIMQPYSFRGQHLDPIQEESRSYCSSSSGSTTTCSSKNLSTHSNASRSANISQQSQHNEDEEPPEVQDLRSLGVMNLKRQVNPFTPETIQFMLQSLPITVTPVHRLPKSSPSMTTGHTVTLADGSSCSVIGKLAKGGFASVYNVKMMNGSTKALKIQNPPCLWEVAIIEELHKRLKANDLLKFSQCFMSVDAVHLYTNSSIIAYNYYPHGTLLDLVNTCRTTSKKLTEAVLLYYTTEICQLVEALHCCGIIHADIKPDNIMLRDIRPITDYTSIRGRGVCLLDFGRAIDAQSFPRGTQFVGSCGTDSFQCIQMLNNEPWSWHTDLHCIAGTVHVLLHLDYMEVIKNAMTGEYVPSKSLPRNYDRVLWMKFFTDLLNWSGEGQPDMKALTQPLSRKLSLNVSHLKLNLNYMWTQMERQRGFPK
ncbi:PREDICTED: serine/threonine-protein kinase ste20-like isoform X14 [Amphimedon queenslandica]|uniref:Protein kinase domain-containing protein n=1 Tax=Amphimedon queenslandica TaxID=400682 RepID=A0AAN0J0I1_AMPQE|nr:PREDICTED: serine/threonine-protein kinase ste20-like isoform X14 [Amphimedon queenslandica]|eukprot:XP_019850524.1 PREDICTED: serine/threonine-protein kinase ste20-like isoform X14 [Amphimedon queenslandica]